MGFYDENPVERTCKRCKEAWPHDHEFYKAEGDHICRACKFEQRQERTIREQNDPALRAKKLAQSAATREKQKTLPTR